MEQRRIRIDCGGTQLTALLNDGPTANMVWDALPLDATGSVWGDEVYFRTPIDAALEDGAGDVVDIGAVAYWPPGRALCLFYGPTPASVGDECRAASAVNAVGAIEGDATALRGTRSGVAVRVERA